jgi:hypothetical protein
LPLPAADPLQGRRHERCGQLRLRISPGGGITMIAMTVMATVIELAMIEL